MSEASVDGNPGVKLGLYESLSGYDQHMGQDFSWVAAWGNTVRPPSKCAGREPIDSSPAMAPFGWPAEADGADVPGGGSRESM